MVLLKWRVGVGAGRITRIEIDNARLVAAESARAGCINRDRRRKRSVSRGRRCDGEDVAVLTGGCAGAVRQEGIDKAACRRGRRASANGAAQRRQTGKADRRIRRRVAHFRSVDRAERASGRGLVR